MKYTIDEFAQILLTQTKTRLAGLYSEEQASWERVQVKPGLKYTKVDIGTEHSMSGKYMVEVATGVIYGIKAYGKIHKGHMYGTLDTVDDWWWGGYTGEKREGREFFPGDVVIWTDGKKCVVQGYLSLKLNVVALKDDIGNKWSAHVSELRHAKPCPRETCTDTLDRNDRCPTCGATPPGFPA